MNSEHTYDDITKMVNSLCIQIVKSEFNPKIIIGIVRGGCVPAVMMSHILKIPMQTLMWSTRDNAHLNVSDWATAEDASNGTKILLVDDIVDSGDTISGIKTDWNDSIGQEVINWGDSVKIASLHYRHTSTVIPDYFVNKIMNDDWQVYPWEAQ